MCARRRRSRIVAAIACFLLLLFTWLSLELHRRLIEQTGLLSHVDAAAQLVRQGPEEATDSKNQTFSACLLVMDDNHYLIEWLAYHYFTLPLSRVIVAVDPRSRTSPNEILERWQGRMQVDRWDDSDYMNRSELEEAEHYVKKFFKEKIFNQPDLVRHRARQRLFYYKCMKRLKAEDQSWVLFIDTDEYLTINYPTVRKLGLTAPPIDQHGSVATFLHTELQRPGNNLTSPCVQIPRLRFGAVESSKADVERLVPSGFNASHFQTLRWRKHAAPRNMVHNKISKAIIDLSRVEASLLAPVDSIHRPVMSLCGHRRLYIQNKDQVFVIHHYLGSRELYFFRDDSRKGRERSATAFEKMSGLDEMPYGNDDLRPWLSGLVRKVGFLEAKVLLDGAGITSSS